MVQIKICGIKDPASAIAAAAAGADLVGLVFAPSRRQITPSQARAIVDALARTAGPVPAEAGDTGLPRPAIVGVFVNADPAEINRLADECQLDYIQLSGDEAPETLANLSRPAIKAVRLQTSADLDRLEAYAARGARLLLDAFDRGAYGGTGRTGDWDLAALAAGRYPIVLAGGLTPANVADAVDRVRPWGVDVSSGVERDGVKDPALIQAFVRAVSNQQSAVGRSDE